MKTEIDNIIKARKLLEAWYDGSAAGADEAWLREFFAAAGDLPADLETERGMFLALDEAVAAPVSMPQEDADRLEQALEAEMRRGGSWKRRRIWMSAAACLLAVTAGVFVTRLLTGAPDYGPDNILATASGMSGIDTLPPPVPASAGTAGATDTAVMLACAPAVTHASGPLNARTTTRAKARKRPSRPAKAEQAGQEMYANAMTDDERQMEAKGYRVVRSEMEAKAVVGLVMAKMQENVVESSFRISDMTESLDRIANAGQKPELSI